MATLSRRQMIGAALSTGFGMTFGANLTKADDLQDGDFKQEVIRLLAEQRPDWTVDPTEDPTSIRIDHNLLSLSNIFRVVEHRPAADRQKAILDFFDSVLLAENRSAAATDISYADAKPRLYPQIIPNEFKDVIKDLVARPFFVDLSVGFALDNGVKYELIHERALKAWGVDPQSLERDAMANLDTLAASQTLEPKRRQQGAYAVCDTTDGYAAARILLPAFMKRLRTALEAPQICVAIPNRDFLLAWTPDFALRTRFAAQVEEDAASRDHPFTDALFMSDETGIRLMDAGELADHGR